MKYLSSYSGSLVNNLLSNQQLCKKYNIKNYTINSDGLIDVDGDVNISGRNLTKIPIKFGRISGSFYCHINKLISLEGAPIQVSGDFFCGHNQLISLKGAPKEVSDDFFCSYNELISLEGSPKEIYGNFDCSHNQLTSLQGAPRKIFNSFDCGHNQLISLQGAPKVSDAFFCNNNPLLPQLILDFMDTTNDPKFIIKNQDDYSIWRKDGTLDEYRFKDMLKDI